MATLREVRRRIAGVKSTQKITKAMKMVAAAKLRRAQTSMFAARPYAKHMKQLLQSLIAYAEGEAAELVRPRLVSTVALVIVTADRGLCGAFNSNLVRAAISHMQTAYPGWHEQGRVLLFCIGKKGSDFFTKRRFKVVQRVVGVYNNLVFAEAQQIARQLVQGYRQGQYDKVEVVFNAFKSIGRQQIAVEQFLPIPSGMEGREAAASPPAAVDYIFEPTKERILAALVPRHLNFQLWQILLESNAAEQGARMAAMDNATENANDLINTLQLQYNKARQAAITKELLEVVSGAEALRQAG